ncbi:MvdC/MvdD family ATP grasp protein [Streptosporangium amethystogenes subsp. fukuiense]|uniref:MvdC/MvdD family ATP grasp protein n=1 Tax=Streptosporangium amethystogenes subsp. fukuiense TaxID=698418 RepID=A0ABW2TFG4_9ACTN
MILIVSSRGDGAAERVLAALRRRGARLVGDDTGDGTGPPVLWWDTADFPGRSRITASFAGGQRRLMLDTGTETVDLSRVTAVWRSRPGKPSAAGTVTEPSHRAHVDEQAEFMLDGVWSLLTARWLPGRRADERRAHNKIFHMARAIELGFSVPDTVYTNDPAELADAYESAEGRLVAKQITAEPFQIDGAEHRAYTTVVTRRHLTSRHRIRHEPVILQPYVPKAVELRVIVVGARVFAAEIDASGSRAARDDWRHYDNDRVRYGVHELPAEVSLRCARLVADVGLTYAALDFIVTPGGEYVFLELNSNGAWGFVELWTGLPVSDAIAGWLMDGGTP